MRKIIAKLEKNGYEALVYSAESGIQGVNIIQSGEKYAPQITDTFGAVTLGETEFVIGTASYGGLAVEEIKEVMAGYEKAIEAVEYFKEKLAIIENATDEEYELIERFDELVTMFEEDGIEYDGSTQEQKYITVHLTAGLYKISVDMNLAAPGYFLSTTDCGGTYTAEMMDEGRNHKYVKTLKGVKGYIERMWQK